MGSCIRSSRPFQGGCRNIWIILMCCWCCVLVAINTWCWVRCSATMKWGTQYLFSNNKCNFKWENLISWNLWQEEKWYVKYLCPSPKTLLPMINLNILRCEISGLCRWILSAITRIICKERYLKMLALKIYWCGHKPRNAGHWQQLEEARVNLFPRASRVSSVC